MGLFATGRRAFGMSSGWVYGYKLVPPPQRMTAWKPRSATAGMAGVQLLSLL